MKKAAGMRSSGFSFAIFCALPRPVGSLRRSPIAQVLQTILHVSGGQSTAQT